MPQTPLLQIEHLTKVFAGVAAIDDINLCINKNEIVSIIGENGAGKSTLCKILCGLYHPDGGTIKIDGQEAVFKTVGDSTRAGISMVHQERNLVGMLTGAQNFCLGVEPVQGMFISEKETMRRAEEARKQLNVNTPLDIPVEKLGSGQQQLIEILRALASSPKILILDEPTSSLGEGEVEPFLNFIKDMKTSMDIAVVFISHKIEEVFSISDRIVVLTDGKLVLEKKASETTQQECIRAMIRSDKVKPIDIEERDVMQGAPLLKTHSGVYDGQTHRLELETYRGEIVGVYGLVGAGRTEFAEVLFGLRKAESVSFSFDGETITVPKTLAMLDKGMILTPELRRNGIFLALPITENVSNLFLKRRLANKLGFIDFEKCKALTDTVLKKNKVKYRRREQAIAELSGGNMQKVILGRSIELENIKLLILDEPTTGMDIGAKYEVYHNLRRLAEENGLSILIISSELDELFAVSDRIYVFSHGNITYHAKRKDFDKQSILNAAIRR